MNHKLPIFTFPLVALVSAAGGQTVTPVQAPSGGNAATSRPAAAAASSLSPGVPAAPSGQRLISDAARALHAQRSLAARIRHRVTISSRPMIGSGEYYQMTGSGVRRHRLELKLRIGEGVASLQQISNGEVLWIRKAMGDSVKLDRVDLRKVRRARAAGGDQIGAQPPAGTPRARLPASGLPATGLAGLLESTGQHFEFGPPRKATLGEMPVWIVRGQSKGENRRHAADHVPRSVEITLGRRDLFPYRLEFFGPGGPTSREGAATPVPLVTMELFGVRFDAPLDPLLFEYRPGDQDVNDRTESYLKRLGIAPPKARRAPALRR